MKLLKRIAAGILAVTMIVSSLPVSSYTVYAAQEAESADAKTPEAIENADAAEETEGAEEADASSPDGAEDIGEPDALEVLPESYRVEEADSQVVTIEGEWDGVYQFGGAPSAGNVADPSLSVESAGGADAADNEDVSGIADYIYRHMLERSESIDVSDYNIEYTQCMSIARGVLNDHPELYFVNKKFGVSYSPYDNCALSINLTYIDGLDDDAFKRETKTALAAVKAGMSDLQKAVVLHDYLTVNCEYDYANYLAGTIPSTSYTAYGVFVKRIAVCEGYALAYKYLLNQAGIECYMVTSDAMNHAWNLVKLDGEYYQVDVTWDDPTWDLVGRSRHAYMFCSDADFLAGANKKVHNGWIVTSGGSVVDYKAADTRYDNAFWSSVNSPLVLAGENWDDCYYVYYDNAAAKGRINKAALSNISGSGTGICDIGLWTSWNGGGYWSGAYSGLFRYNDRLYYNDKSSIYSIALDGTDKKTEFTADTTSGYIYGSALCQGKVLYSLHQTPNMNERETVLTADIDIDVEDPLPTIIPVENIELDKAELTLEEGKTAELKATVTPSNATDAAVTWESSDESVAKVTDGIVTAVAAGSCSVTAKAGDKTAVCKVTVTEGEIVEDIANGSYGDITWRIDGNGKLTVEGSGEFSGTAGISRAPWYSKNKEIKSAEVNVTGMTDASRMFYGCSELASVDMSKFDTGKVTNMSYMFHGCSNLPELDVSSFDTGQVTNMDSMFYGCSSLTGIDVSNFDTSKVTYMSDMFYGCSNLQKLDVSNFNTGNVTDMRSMFNGCSKLQKLDVSKFDTAKVTSMMSMFNSCAYLPELDVSRFDTGSVTNMSSMFGDCSNLPELDVSNFNTGNVTNMRSMFNGCSKLLKLDVSNFDTGKVTNMSSMFYGCSTLPKLDVSNFDTGNVTDISGMFYNCSTLPELDVSKFDTGNVTNMRLMFNGCSNLLKLDVSNFDTGKVTNMSDMFYNCSKLPKLDVNNFNTGNVTDMLGMFNGCSNLSELNVSSFDTAKVTNMLGMFYECSNLLELDISNFDTGKVTNASGMLYGCTGLLTIYTPCNLSRVAALPAGTGDVWYDADGNTYTELPKNLSYSIILYKNEIPVISEPYITATKSNTTYECGDTINLDDLTVKYYDGSGAETEVTSAAYSTNATEIVMSTPGTKELVITYNNGTTDLTTTIELTVTEKTGTEEPLPMQTVSDPQADYYSGTVKKGTRITLSTDTTGAEIYYTTDGSIPTTASYRYTGPITVTETVTIKAYAVKEGYKDSGVVEFNYIVSKNSEGLKVEFKYPGRTYIYTGSAVKPEIIVTNNGEPLTEGIDYTVKYSNNVKASGTAKITVTGKGNLTGSKTKEFTILAKRLDNGDVNTADTAAPKVEGDYATVAEGSKVSPALLYGGTKLTSKDFKFADDQYKAYKWKMEDNGIGGIGRQITVTAQENGNFTGSRVITVRVISKEEQGRNKLNVTLDKGAKDLTYNGEPQTVSKLGLVTVSTKNTPSGLIEAKDGKNGDYVISYPSDITSAGAKKFTVVGISDRCTGTVTKSYTIKPKKTELAVEYDLNKSGYPFVSTGTTIDDLVVKDGNITLDEGVDYKVAYSGNKKAGTAKFTVTGLGSYKGSKYAGTFTINPAALNNNAASAAGMTKGLEIAIADKVFKKPGAYKSAPYVSINGVLIKASEYDVTYYLDNPAVNASPRVMDNKENKVTNENGDTTVWVKITGKGSGNFATKDNTCYAIASYKVRSLASSDSYDLSKAKVAFIDKDGKSVKKADYTGSPITGDDIRAVVTYKIGKETVTLKEGEHYTVEYVNNVNKGKATVVITGKGSQTKYVGSKTATFSIAANSVKNITGWF